MAELKTGNGVMIKTREVTPEDIKSGLYFLYFGGLVGKVDRIYDDGSVCVDVDIDSLSKEARSRHLAMQEAERKRWLENLSGEARNRLTPEQRQLRISYKLLVSKNDLEPHKGLDKPKIDPKAIAEVADESYDTETEGPAESSDLDILSEVDNEEETTNRLTEADLAAREEEFLKSLQEKQ